MNVDGPALSRPAVPIGFGAGNLYGGKQRAQSLRLVAAALDAGITWFDTARLYGHGAADGLLGEALEGRRDRVTIIGKAGILPSRISFAHRVHAKLAALRLLPAPAPVEPKFGAFEPSELRASVETSLRALRTDYLDGLLLHEVPAETARRDEVTDLLEILRREGKVRAFGAATSLEDTLSLARNRPSAYEVLQFASSAWTDNAGCVRTLAGDALVVTHSALGAPLAGLIQRLQHDEALRARARELGIDPARPNLGPRLLALAMLRNPGGVTLFSSTKTERIAEAVTALAITVDEAMAAERFIQAP